ncbi:MAG: SGNH/GDSL hydrolase family protein [Myxococcota bacterium]
MSGKLAGAASEIGRPTRGRRADWPVVSALTALCLAPGCGDDGPLFETGGGSSGTTGDVADSTATTLPAAGTSTGEPPGGPDTGVDTGSTGTPADGSSTGQPAGDSSSSGGGNPPGAVAECFEGLYVNSIDGLGPDYDQFRATPGSHCQGTDHQDIAGVQRAVFLGDSVTVGTPPWAGVQYYRSLVADALEAEFGLQFGQGFLQDETTWKGANVFEGQAGVIRSGDFAACAEWGARTDDLTPTQIPQCFEEGDFDATTLVIMTMGGNDIANMTKNAIDGATMEEMWAQAQEMVDLKREAVEWLVEPDRFPNGVFVVFANVYEFTDGTGEVESCDVSALAGFDQPVPAPDDLADVVVWIQEQYMDIAVSTSTDMVFMFEGFCGHGFNADNPEAPCYRGPGNENWFDFTCTHPNDVGHIELADMFVQTITE